MFATWHMILNLDINIFGRHDIPPLIFSDIEYPAVAGRSLQILTHSSPKGARVNDVGGRGRKRVFFEKKITPPPSLYGEGE